MPEVIRWIGNGLMKGGKGYAPTPLGQIHYRMCGEGATPVLLLHQTPWSISQYSEIQNHLAVRGLRTLAVDTPGYGLSDPLESPPTITRYADNLIAVLDHLQIDRVVVAGHHTGACIAAHFAARYPDRTAGVVLHGMTALDDRERYEFLEKLKQKRGCVLEPDGSHFSSEFTRLYEQDPSPRNLVTTSWSVINFYLSGEGNQAYSAVFTHDSLADVRAIKSPTLVLSDAADVLHDFDVRTAQLRPDFAYIQFSTGNMHAHVNEPHRWAEIVSEFAGELPEYTGK